MNRDPGWYADPYFRHHERYWDNGWTDEFRLLGESRRDAIGATAAEVPSAATIVSRAAVGSDSVALAAAANPVHRASAVRHEDDTLVVPAISRHDTGRIPVVVPDETLVVPRVSRNAASTNGAASPAQVPRAWDGGAATEEQAVAGRARTRRRRVAAVAVTFLVVVAAVVVAFIATNGSAQGGAGSASSTGTSAAVRASSPGAGGTVVSAATLSAREKSVVMSFDVTLTTAGQPTPQQGLSGSGGFYLKTGLGALTVNLPNSPAAQAQKFVFRGNTAYVNVAASAVPGKTWVVASTSDLPSTGSGSTYSDFVGLLGNPGELVRALKHGLVSAAPLGTSVVDGVPVKRYGVSLSSGPKAWSAGYGTHTSEEVDIGGDKLVHQIVIPTQISVGGQKFQENIVVVFLHYGAPLYVGPPPTGQLVTLAQYEAAVTTGAGPTKD